MASQDPRLKPTTIVLDIDRFKAINDAIGLSAGDSILLTLSRRLGRLLRPQDTLARLNVWRKKFLTERGTRFVFPSDELYLLAGEPLPTEEEYEGFPMLENGVGMIRDFLSEPLPPLPAALPEPRKVIQIAI